MYAQMHILHVHEPYSQKCWQSKNLVDWPPRLCVVILVECTLSTVVCKCQCTCIANLAVWKRIAKPPSLFSAIFSGCMVLHCTTCCYCILHSKVYFSLMNMHTCTWTWAEKYRLEGGLNMYNVVC